MFRAKLFNTVAYKKNVHEILHGKKINKVALKVKSVKQIKTKNVKSQEIKFKIKSKVHFSRTLLNFFLYIALKSGYIIKQITTRLKNSSNYSLPKLVPKLKMNHSM